MNPVTAVISRADALQQRYTVPGFTFGVIKKYGDDNGGVLVASLAYAGFVSLFPLLLVLVTILGLVASGDPELRARTLDAVANQVPLIGHQLTGNVHQLRRSSIIGLAVGLAVLIWGATRLAQAGIFTMEQVWNLPGPARPGYVPRLGRAALFLVVLGLGVIVTTGLTALDAFGHHHPLTVIGAEIVAAAANAGMYVIGFRVLTPGGVPTRRLLPGAIAGGVAWTLLQLLGTYLVRHAIDTAAVYGVFATVLGLVAWVYLGVQSTVLAAEVNSVLAWRLWPRAIVQPPLTEADRASMALQALQNQRREEQLIEVTFNDRPEGERPGDGTPRTPGDIVGPQRP
ncbi:MAG TPA: YihY/virulence factor BrkB family protein [Streptosporangiaceae bacterium]|nr:YihY/virulence factor BrkB family protein [Streptosporangiaceae bacterium]